MFWAKRFGHLMGNGSGDRLGMQNRPDVLERSLADHSQDGHGVRRLQHGECSAAGPVNASTWQPGTACYSGVWTAKTMVYYRPSVTGQQMVVYLFPYGMPSALNGYPPLAFHNASHVVAQNLTLQGPAWEVGSCTLNGVFSPELPPRHNVELPLINDDFLLKNADYIEIEGGQLRGWASHHSTQLYHPVGAVRWHLNGRCGRSTRHRRACVLPVALGAWGAERNASKQSDHTDCHWAVPGRPVDLADIQ